MYTITAITKIIAITLQILCHSCANIHATNTKNCQYAMDPHLSAMERKEAFYWIANCLSYKNWQHAYMRLTIYINVRRRRIGKITTTKNILLGFYFALIHIKNAIATHIFKRFCKVCQEILSDDIVDENDVFYTKKTGCLHILFEWI